MASSLPLRGILILRVRVDPTAAVLSKSMWLAAFPRALWITELFVDNAQVPALASALGSQDFYERNAMTRLFPRLAHVVLSKVEMRDILFLDRAIRRRAPQPQMILGRFIIDAEVVKRKPSHPAVVFVKPDGSRVPVSTTSIKKDSWGTTREWFDVRKALKAQSERRRVRNTDKDARVSVYEHLYALGKHTCFRHKHALQSAAISG
ncbi:hypothetical protein PENSPDRAFT_694326 [Peniophora sp. CONT]|nr:hypothetical protein PENSPDRAFT_694326 [Peniophora sp. CONT]